MERHQPLPGGAGSTWVPIRPGTTGQHPRIGHGRGKGSAAGYCPNGAAPQLRKMPAQHPPFLPPGQEVCWARRHTGGADNTLDAHLHLVPPGPCGTMRWQGTYRPLSSSWSHGHHPRGGLRSTCTMESFYRPAPPARTLCLLPGEQIR